MEWRPRQTSENITGIGILMKTNTHFCDYCGKEMWGEEVQHFKEHEFCSPECIDGYCSEEVRF